MAADPFRIEGPASISFSGGRTSAYADLAREVYESPEMDFLDEGTPEYDAECGDSCGGDSPEELLAMQRIYERGRVTA